MSLFGKVLALLNIFGAIALVCFAAMDYGKRASWAYANFRTERVLRGLPLNEDERDDRGVKIAAQIGKETFKDLMRGAGPLPAQPTQKAELEFVKGKLDTELAGATGVNQESAALAGVLLPLADTLAEHEQLLACRAWLAKDDDAKKLSARYLAAFRSAKASPLPGEPFDNSFRAALRTLPVQSTEPAQPTEALTTLVLGKLPAAADEAGFGKVYTAALTEQRDKLKARYDELFNRALTGTVGGQQMNLGPQKAAVARLLFGIAVYRVEKEFPREAKETAAKYGQRVAASPQFGTEISRVYAVCGLRHGLDAVTERTAVLRQMAGELRSAMSSELMAFVADHSALVEQAREAAYLLRIEIAKKQESVRRKGVQDTQIKRREEDVKQLNQELETSRELTKKMFKELSESSQKLLESRVNARNRIRETEEAERTIRKLEDRIRQLEKDE